jgi:hypothetical protein
LEAYHAAISLLPHLATLGLDLQSRQEALASSAGLACDAASCAIQSGRYCEAVELLEGGRAVFWSQALQLRTPMDDLRDAEPELERELRQISFALEQGSMRELPRNLSHTSQKKISMEQEASNFRRLNNQWLATIEKVRQLDNFKDFLLPVRFSALHKATSYGNIVILTSSKLSGSDALVLTSSGVHHIPFQGLDYEQLSAFANSIRLASSGQDIFEFIPEADGAHVDGHAKRMSSFPETVDFTGLWAEARKIGRAPGRQIPPDETFRSVLASLWRRVVEPIILSLNLKVRCITNAPLLKLQA